MFMLAKKHNGSGRFVAAEIRYWPDVKFAYGNGAQRHPSRPASQAVNSLAALAASAIQNTTTHAPAGRGLVNLGSRQNTRAIASSTRNHHRVEPAVIFGSDDDEGSVRQRRRDGCNGAP